MLDRSTKGLRAWLAGKWPVIRGVSLFLACMGAFYAVIQNPWFDFDFVFEPYCAWIARTTGWFLNLLGQGVHVDGVLIAPTGPAGEAVKIARGCDALEPAAAFVSAVVASPARRKRKCLGMLVGVALLLSVNLVRVVALFLVLSHWGHDVFDVLHHDVGQVAFIVLAVACWAVWAHWATLPDAPGEGEHGS